MEIRQLPIAIASQDYKLQNVLPDLITNQKEVAKPEIKIGEEQITPKQMKELVQGANKFFESTKTHLQFHLHETLNSHYVEIRNSETNEVIKEIPSKKFLDMVAKFQELAGLIVDEKI
jgi:flagellar protein FlaG